MKDNIEKIFTYIEKSKFYFKLFYLFVSLTVVTVLKTIPYINVLSKVALLWGMIIIIYMIFSGYKKRKIYKFDFALQVFLVLTLVLTLIFYRTRDNLVEWVVNFILFVSIYTIDIFDDKKKLIKEMNIITYFYTGFMFIISIISLFMHLISENIIINGLEFYGGKDGLFENKNAISIAAAIAIGLCIYLVYSTSVYKLKLYLIGNIVIQLITMATFKGRSSFLIIIGIIYTIIFVYNKNKFLRFIMIVAPIILVGVLYTQADFTTIRLFTSGRNNLWRAACVVIKWYPFIGVGKSALIDNIMAAKVTFDLPGLKYGGLHNIYFQIATLNGIIALILFLLFLFGLFSFLLKRLEALKKREKLKMTILVSVLVGVLAVNMFESSLIYIISFIGMIFWIYSGYIISILDNRNFN